VTCEPARAPAAFDRSGPRVLSNCPMSLNLRLLTPALLIVLACTPKAEDSADDGDLSSGGGETNGGSSDTEPVTTGDSDPTMPGTATTPGTASEPATTTTPGTSVGTTPDTEGSDEATSATSATTIGTDATDSDTDTDDPPPPVPCAGDPEPIVAETIIAYTQAQIPPEPDPSTVTVSSTTNGEPNPSDTLYIKLSDQQFTCADPNAILECGPHWEFTIIIAPEFQFPGLYNLAGNGPFATVSETSEGMNNDCAGGGGAGFGGTFELINITDVTVEGRLCGVDGLFTFTDPDLNGSFVAERCE